MAECILNEDASDEEGPPPLEDMTEMLERARQSKHSRPQAPSKEPPSAHQKITKGKSSPEETKRNGKDMEGGFGGLQKGFLFSSKPPKSATASEKSKTGSRKSIKYSTGAGQGTSGQGTSGQGTSEVADDIIRPKKQNSESSGLEFPEVQEAMKESYPFLNTENWVTDNLLAKVEKNPVLSKAFKDPAMAQALAQFQANPQQALVATKDKPEIQKFLQTFCAVMGEHFTELGDAEEKKRGSVSEIITQEEAQMKEILSKPEVKRVLEDPSIRKLIETLKTDPNAAQQVLRCSSPEMKLKIKVLIDNGLLALQQ